MLCYPYPPPTGIDMKIDPISLQSGTYRNYKDLCDHLGITDTSRGNTQKAILRELDRFWEYSREGHKYILHKLKETPDMANMRKDNVWLKVTVANMLKMLADQAPTSSSDVYSVFVDKFTIYEYIGLCNESYKYNKKEYIDEIIEYPSRTDSVTSFFYDTVSNQMHDICVSLIRHIKNNYAQHVVECYKIKRVGSKEEELTSIELTQKIFDICDKEAKKIGCSRFNHVHKSRRRDECFANIDKRLREEHGIIKCKKGYLFSVTNYILVHSKYAEAEVAKVNKLLANDTISTALLDKGKEFCESLFYLSVVNPITGFIETRADRQKEAFSRYSALLDTSVKVSNETELNE